MLGTGSCGLQTWSPPPGQQALLPGAWSCPLGTRSREKPQGGWGSQLGTSDLAPGQLPTWAGRAFVNETRRALGPCSSEWKLWSQARPAWLRDRETQPAVLPARPSPLST